MFGTIRKHQKWLWAIIITFTIVSFVIFFSPYTRVGNALGKGPNSLGSINGDPVSFEEYRDAVVEVFLRHFLTHGTWPDKDLAARQAGFDEQREAYYRLLLIQKQKEFKIHPSNKAVVQLAADILRSLNRGNPLPFEVFEKQVLSQRGYTAADFERFLKHELGIQQLASLVGVSGRFVTPQEAESIYRHDYQEVLTEAVFFSASNYLSRVSANAEAVAQFYTNQMPNYRLPERIQVSYVKFELTNFWAEADEEMKKLTNLTAIVDNIYLERGTNYYGKDKSPQEAKEAIKQEIRRDLALRSARKQAGDFADTLLGIEPLRSENLEKLAAEKGLSVKVTAPFDRDEGPQDLNVPLDFVRRAFNLTTEEPIAGPIIAEDGVYVIALHKQIPSEIPPFESIREKVKADWQFSEAVQLARQAGTNFYATLTNAMAKGESFTNICRGAGLTPVELPSFSRSTQSLPEFDERAPFGLVQEVAFRLSPGKVSNFISTLDGGFILHLKSRLPLDEEKVKKELPRFLAYLRQKRQNEAFNDWFRREAELGLRQTPLARPPQLAETTRTPK